MELEFIGATGYEDEVKYLVMDVKAKTVGEFVQEVLSERKDEWGDIEGGDPLFSEKLCSYCKGELVEEPDKDYIDLEIEDVFAHGGYTKVDYLITYKKYKVIDA